MRKWWTLAVNSALILTFLTGCQLAPPKKVHDKLQVVTTFYPMYEFSKQVAGDDADVSVLIPAGTEPHDWEPKPRDVVTVANADVFVYNGAGLEYWADDVLRAVNEPELTVVDASKGLSLLQGTAKPGQEVAANPLAEKEDTSIDPHVWLDPVLAEQEVRHIAAAFEQADPKHAADYRKNAAAYLNQLQALDRDYQTVLKKDTRREFVTSHAAFGYLAHQYGLTQLSITGLDPEQEPTPAEMANIVSFVKQHHTKTIFFETLASPKVAQAVAREVGAGTDVLNPLEGLTEEEQKQGLDYIKVMKQNLAALDKALSQ